MASCLSAPVFPQLLDLCVLDVGCLEFPYGVLAASALYHFSSLELMQKVSGRLGFAVRSQTRCLQGTSQLSPAGIEPLTSLLAGYQWCDIEKCVKWMVPFAMVIREMGSSKLKHFRGVPMEDSHNIQTHTNSLDLLVSNPLAPIRQVLNQCRLRKSQF